MWRQVLIPTLLVSLIWVVVGSATTFYINWATELQARMLAENVGTIQAVANMQNTLLQLQSLTTIRQASPAGAPASGIEDLLSECEQELLGLEKTATTTEEAGLSQELRQQFFVYCAHLREWTSGKIPPQFVPETASPIIAQSLSGLAVSFHRLASTNERLLSQSVKDRSRVDRWLIPLRTGFMVLGPLLGVVCGVWIARGFRHSIARISVTLSSTETGSRQSLGLVTVTPADDLATLHHQVEAVGERIRGVVDQLHQTRQQLMRSEQLAAVGQLAAGVAHELRNPLTSVKLLIQTAARRGPRGNLGEKQLWVIQEEIARMENTIQGLLDFARPPKLDRVRHDLRETVERAVSLVEGRAKQQKVAVCPQLPERPIMVNGDHAQIHQVFVNLLLNGMDAAGSGGVLRVVLTESDASGCGCQIAFHDSGNGIPEEVLSRLFDPFVTTKEQGIGLGLAVSRRIVEEHGGTIVAANHAEGGAVFTVMLPTSTAGAAPPAPPEQPDDKQL